MTPDYLKAFDGDADDIFSRFDRTAPAPERVPLPGGLYLAQPTRGEAVKTATGKDAYRMIFEVTAPASFAGLTITRTWVFTEKALPYAKRDLALFGLTTAAGLLQPLPAGVLYVCRLTIALQQTDAGARFNDIKNILVVKTEPAAANPFALTDADPPRPAVSAEDGPDGSAADAGVVE